MGAEYHLTKSIDSERTNDSEDQSQESEQLLEAGESGFIRRPSNRRISEYLHIFLLYIAIIGLSVALFFSTSKPWKHQDPSQQVWCEYITSP
jgi:hypothetical protein